MATGWIGRGYYPNAKLTAEEVLAIRTRYAEGGITYAELARQYGVRVGAIGKAVRRESWTVSGVRKKLTDVQVCEIREQCHRREATALRLAAVYGVSREVVYEIARGSHRPAATRHLRQEAQEAEGGKTPRAAGQSVARGRGAQEP